MFPDEIKREPMKWIKGGRRIFCIFFAFFSCARFYFYSHAFFSCTFFVVSPFMFPNTQRYSDVYIASLVFVFPTIECNAEL